MYRLTTKCTTKKRERSSLSTLATIVADFGDNLSPKTAFSATVAVFDDSVTGLQFHNHECVLVCSDYLLLTRRGLISSS